MTRFSMRSAVPTSPERYAARRIHDTDNWRVHPSVAHKVPASRVLSACITAVLSCRHLAFKFRPYAAHNFVTEERANVYQRRPLSFKVV